MAHEDLTDVKRKIAEDVEAKKTALEKSKEPYDHRRAEELVEAYQEMNAVIVGILQALQQHPFNNEGDRRRAQEVISSEMADALAVLRDRLAGCANDSTVLIENTRGELEKFGAAVAKGPQSYPKPVFGFLGASQLDQWIRELDRNPDNLRDILNEVASSCKGSADETAAAAAAEGAKREGVRVSLTAKTANTENVMEQRLKKLKRT